MAFLLPKILRQRNGEREKKDVRHRSTEDLHQMATQWKAKKDAEITDLRYDAWEIEDRWGKDGVGPRDVLRAGWSKDVGDVEYIIGAYKDPSKDAFSWWYTTISGTITAQLKQNMHGF